MEAFKKEPGLGQIGSNKKKTPIWAKLVQRTRIIKKAHAWAKIVQRARRPNPAAKITGKLGPRQNWPKEQELSKKPGLGQTHPKGQKDQRKNSSSPGETGPKSITSPGLGPSWS